MRWCVSNQRQFPTGVNTSNKQNNYSIPSTDACNDEARARRQQRVICLRARAERLGKVDYSMMRLITQTATNAETP